MSTNLIRHVQSPLTHIIRPIKGSAVVSYKFNTLVFITVCPITRLLPSGLRVNNPKKPKKKKKKRDWRLKEQVHNI